MRAYVEPALSNHSLPQRMSFPEKKLSHLSNSEHLLLSGKRENVITGRKARSRCHSILDTGYTTHSIDRSYEATEKRLSHQIFVKAADNQTTLDPVYEYWYCSWSHWLTTCHQIHVYRQDFDATDVVELAGRLECTVTMWCTGRYTGEHKASIFIAFVWENVSTLSYLELLNFFQRR